MTNWACCRRATCSSARSTLARNEREARKILLARLPMLEHGRLAGHTGGNLLLSMMEQYTGDFIAAVDGLRGLLGCRGHVWPITVERSTICAESADGWSTRGELEVDRGQAGGRAIGRLWLDPPVSIHPKVANAIRSLDAVVIGPGSYFTSLLPIFLVDGCREALAAVDGPVIYVANLLTEGRGMAGFTAGDAIARLRAAIGRPIDAVVFNVEPPPGRRARALRARGQACRCRSATIPDGCQVIEGGFWRGAHRPARSPPAAGRRLGRAGGPAPAEH